MKKFLLSAILVFCFSFLFAQMPGMGGGKGMPNMGRVYGKLVDSTGKAISEASVMLLQNKYDSSLKKNKEVLLKGMVTQTNGDFNFEELPIFRPLKLKISAVGHKAIEQAVTIQPKMDPNAVKAGSNQVPDFSAMASAFEKDLGKITMKTDLQELSNVTVTSSNSRLRMDIDKKVFNVDQNIVTTGGTAVDVMKNVPSVNVDIDGNVTLRNATPQIYIDGRPTTLTLDQIPADAIESVEVITNPSAKYDASGGTAGILNIVLKKNKKNGFNGNLRAGVDKRGAMNGGGDFNLRQNKINFSASGMVNQNKSRTTGTTDRINLYDNPLTTVRQENNNKTSGQFVFGRIGMDYFVTNRTTLSAGAIKVNGEFDPKETIDILTDSIYNTGKISSMSERTSSGTREFNANGLTFGMKHLFPKEGEELTADINYFSGKNGGNNIYVTNYFDNAGGKIGEHQQQVISDGTNKFLTIQSDYVKPFKKIKLETGVRAQLRKLSNDNQNYILDPTTGEFVLIPSATSNYKNNDNVYAAYVSLTGSKKNFGYKAGLRAESSEYTGVLLNDNSKFSNSYPISLFPSLFLSQKLNNKQELQLSVTRRINRPNFFQLIPYVDYTDNLNITQGNPDLRPEFTSSFEFSYAKTFKGNNTFLASAYYKASTDLITRYQDKGIHPITGQEVLINTYINANSSRAYGTEFTSVNTLKKWWDISTNINVYNSEINTDNVASQLQNGMWSWFGKFNSNFKLPAKFTAQFTATYQSKTNLPVSQGGGFMGPPMGAAQSAAQGYIKSTYGFDVAFKKSFLKNDAASVSFSVNDIFKTRKSEQHSFSQYFIQDYSRQRDPQMFRLNFTYRFGKMDMSLFKRKNMKSDMSGATDGMQQ